MKKLILVLSLVSLFPLSVFAGGNDTSDGCGLGWQVTDKKTWIATTTRGTTNAFIPPTFGMTSGTIGCDQHPIAKNEVDAAVYASTNYDSLSADMAVGQGEYVSGLAKTMGCDDSVIPAFNQMTQKNYKDIMNTQSGVGLYENVKSQVQKDVVLSASCHV